MTYENANLGLSKVCLLAKIEQLWYLSGEIQIRRLKNCCGEKTYQVVFSVNIESAHFTFLLQVQNIRC